MPYLNLDINYFDHPKTARLQNILGNGSDVLPLRLWTYCGKFHQRTGILGRKSVTEIERVLGWWGDGGIAVKAMVRVGFMRKGRDGYAVNDWKSHQGHIYALSQRNKKAAVNRWRKLKGGAVNNASTVEKLTVPLVEGGKPVAPPFPPFPSPSSFEKQTGSLDRTDLTALIASAADKRANALRDVKLLDLKMPFGRYEGVQICDLPVEYCEWLQRDAAEHAKLGRDLRDGLRLRVKIKAEETERK